VAEPKVIPDDLLRQIIGVGQVDLLVGLPTHEHAGTIAEIIAAVRSCLSTNYPRLRTAVLHLDRASSDETPLAAAQAWEAWRAQAGKGLRTTHLMAAAAGTGDGDGDVIRTILACGDLLQAGVVAVVDPDVEPGAIADVAGLASLVINDGRDFASPVYTRGPTDGLLVTQFVRPLIQTVYARRLAEPLAPMFACSGRLAAHCTQAAWNATPSQRATRIWVTTEALAGPFAVGQYARGPRRAQRGRGSQSLQEVFPAVVLSTFASIEAHADAWVSRGEIDEVPVSGRPDSAPEDPPTSASTRPTSSFAQDVVNLAEILGHILAPETLSAVQAASADTAEPTYPDALWAETVADFLDAFHRSVMLREHIVQALMPLYRARIAAFLGGSVGPSTAVETAAMSLAAHFEHTRPRIVQRWTHQHEVQHG